MLPPGLQTPREVTRYYDDIYDSLIESGQAFPFLYPWAGFGAFVVIGYLLIDHRQSPVLAWLRYPVFAFLCAFQGWCLQTNKARHPAAAFGVGLISAFGVLWVAAIMMFNDCQADFRRLEYTTDRECDESQHSVQSLRNESMTNGNSDLKTDVTVLRKRSIKPSRVDRTPGYDGLITDIFYWETYPKSFSRRLDWISDVFCSFRGVGWNWQVSGIPPLATHVERKSEHGGVSLRGEQVTVSKTGVRRFHDRASLIREVLKDLVLGYFALDVVKTLMHNDAYFWGYMDAAPPAYLPRTMRESFVLVKSYRLLICLFGVYFALWEIFKLGPLVFCGVLGPRWIRLRGEPWMNPADFFGSFRGVLDKGLAGWWGNWWHQVFRFTFEAAAAKLLDTVGVNKRSLIGRVSSLFMAFFLSGILHASGSYTQLGDTRPLMGPMRFFLLQPIGIIAQTVMAHQLARVGVLARTPKVVRQAVNLVLVHVWLYYTAPLLMDDFAKGGVWLYEPVAISPLRALGLGAKDDTWFCWWNGLVWWRSGKHWWDTGLGL